VEDYTSRQNPCIISYLWGSRSSYLIIYKYVLLINKCYRLIMLAIGARYLLIIIDLTNMKFINKIFDKPYNISTARTPLIYYVIYSVKQAIYFQSVSPFTRTCVLLIIPLCYNPHFSAGTFFSEIFFSNITLTSHALLSLQRKPSQEFQTLENRLYVSPIFHLYLYNVSHNNRLINVTIVVKKYKLSFLILNHITRIN